MEQEVRTRFAPSPTGFLHIGSLRTALFSYLFARKNKGQHVLRIEDTDQNRLVEGSVMNLLKVTNLLGIDFDEGFYLNEKGEIAEKGNYGPYLQSKRLEIYKKYALELVDKNLAYYCFCSDKRLDELRKEQIALKKPPMYDRMCRNLSVEERDSRLEEFQKLRLHPVIRQAIPLEGTTIIKDLIYGDIRVENKILDDQVLLKSDGFPTYHLAVVVDDHEMKITHVIRGEEWIASTPKHLLLYKAFGWEPTFFAHLPLILNPDKSKLSKRQGDVSVESYLEKGYLKEALINFVAFLGWNPKTEQEIFSLEDLVESFDLKKINKAGAVFDLNKLDWMNGLYIRNKSLDELSGLLKPYWEKSGLKVSEYDEKFLQEIVILEKDRLKKLSDISERTEYFFKTPAYEASQLIWKKSDKEATLKNLELVHQFISSSQLESKTLNDIEVLIKDFISSKGLDNGSVLWPLRVSLTGLSASPSPFEVIYVLLKQYPKQELLNRIEKAIDKLK